MVKNKPIVNKAARERAAEREVSADDRETFRVITNRKARRAKAAILRKAAKHS